MVGISAFYVVTLYLLIQIEDRTKVQQRWQRCDRIDEDAAPVERYQRSELDIGQAAKSVEKHSTGYEGN